MRYQELGSTGLKISIVGFGGIPIQRIDQERSIGLIKSVHDHGINFIDTARAYTTSEAWIGEALKQTGLRDQFVIATKAPAVTAEDMEKALAASFRDLQTDYIDLYQLHNLAFDKLKTAIAPGGALEVLKKAKEEGRIGHIGVTTHSAAVFEFALEQDWVETIMFPYNIVETQGTELIERCAQKGIGFIDMKPLAGGAIENAELAIRFILSNPHVSVAIPGMAEIAEVEQNCAAAENTAALSEEECKAMEAIRSKLGTSFCRRCNYCAPCTVGISIPSVFLFQGYLERYDLAGWAKDRYASIPVKASACIECGACEPRCPYGLPIRQMLKKAAAEFGE